MAIAAAAVGAIASGISSRKAAKKQNQYMMEGAGKLDPANINAGAAQFNPALWRAMRGYAGNNGYQQSLYNMIQNPGYIDPALMNAPYTQSAQRQQQDLGAAQALLGRNAIGGGTGLGQAYALANQAARTGRDVQIGQQYALWREQQRRADLDWLAGQQQQSQQMAFQSAGGQANLLANRQAPQSWLGIGGNAIQSGLAAYGGMQAPAGGGGPSGGQPPYQNAQQPWWGRY